MEEKKIILSIKEQEYYAVALFMRKKNNCTFPEERGKRKKEKFLSSYNFSSESGGTHLYVHIKSKTQRISNWILNFAPHVPSNFLFLYQVNY